MLSSSTVAPKWRCYLPLDGTVSPNEHDPTTPRRRRAQSRADPRRRRRAVRRARPRRLARRHRRRRRASGVGTVYRRFPDKDALIDALFEVEDRPRRRARRAMRSRSRTRGRASPPSCAACAACRRRTAASRTRCCCATAGASGWPAARERIAPRAMKLLARAQEAGAVRSDLGPFDVPMLNLCVGLIADRTRDIAPDYWERVLTIVIDGISAAGRRPRRCRSNRSTARPSPRRWRARAAGVRSRRRLASPSSGGCGEGGVERPTRLLVFSARVHRRLRASPRPLRVLAARRRVQDREARRPRRGVRPAGARADRPRRHERRRRALQGVPEARHQADPGARGVLRRRPPRARTARSSATT